jgi:DNA recombination protein RmuC
MTLEMAVYAGVGAIGILFGWLVAQRSVGRLRTLAENADARSSALENQSLRFRAKEMADATALAKLSAQLEAQTKQAEATDAEMRRQLAEARKAAVMDRERAEILFRSQSEIRGQLEGERRALKDRIELNEQAQERAAALEASFRAAADELVTVKQELGVAREQLKAAQEQLASQQSWVNEQSQGLRSQFAELAGQLLAEKSSTLQQTNHSAIDGLIGPLRQQLADFQSRVDQTHELDSRDRAGLAQLLEGIGKTQAVLSERTDSLSRALGSEPGAAGALGSLRLELQLRAAGLEEGRHYLRHAEQPDGAAAERHPHIAILLPDRSAYIAVDAGCKLGDWEQAAAATGEAARDAAMARHGEAVRQYVEELGRRSYAPLAGGDKPVPYTVMYLPIEGAATAALERDPELLGRAHRQKVVLATPATLFLIVGAIGHLWRVAAQESRAEAVVAQAAQLLQRLDDFVEGFAQVGQALEGAQRLFSVADTRLRSGDQNALALAGRLRALSAAVPIEAAEGAGQAVPVQGAVTDSAGAPEPAPDSGYILMQ